MENEKPKSKKSFLPVIFLLVLLVLGLCLGPIGAGFFPFQLPENLRVPRPHVKLPAEEIVHVGDFSITNTLIASWLTILVLAVLFYFCTRKMRVVPGRLQALAEIIVESLLGFVEGVAGKATRKASFPRDRNHLYLCDHQCLHGPSAHFRYHRLHRTRTRTRG